jgi:hypothetical protein
MSAITTFRGDQRIKLYNEIKKLDPTFDVGLIDHRVKFLGQYEDPKGRAAINRKSLNNIIMHTADLLTASAKYVRSDTRLFNTPINMLARQGSQQWQAYQTPFAVLAGEIELYFTGGYAPQGHDKARWDNVVNGTSTPKQIEQFARDIIHVALRRADSDNSQFNTNMGYDDPNMISPSAMAAAEFVSEDIAKEAKTLGSGGSIGRGNRAKSPGRFVGVYPGGEEAFDTQAQLDEFIAKAKAQGVVVTVKTSAAPESPGKADYLWDPVSKTLKKVGG